MVVDAGLVGEVRSGVGFQVAGGGAVGQSVVGQGGHHACTSLRGLAAAVAFLRMSAIPGTRKSGRSGYTNVSDESSLSGHADIPGLIARGRGSWLD